MNLTQALVIEDETTGDELVVVTASFCDPYLLLLCEDSSVKVFEANKDGEIEEVERSDGLLTHKWTSGCLYKGAATLDKPLLFLLGAEGGLHVSTYSHCRGLDTAKLIRLSCLIYGTSDKQYMWLKDWASYPAY